MLSFETATEMRDTKGRIERINERVHITAHYRGLLDEDLESLQEDFVHVLGATLRTSQIWPIRTGRSLRNFYAQKIGKEIHIYNTTHYAGFVNGIKRFKSGKRNRNYQAVQKWLTARAEKIAERVIQISEGQ